MIYTFKSRATNNVLMLEAVAKRILEILGKDPDAATGIVLPEQIAAAIASLRAAIASEEASCPPTSNRSPDNSFSESRDEVVALRQRAAPFIAMLERSMVEEREVVWSS